MKFGIHAEHERGVLLVERMETGRDPVFVPLGFREDSGMEDRFGKLRRREHDGRLLLASVWFVCVSLSFTTAPISPAVSLGASLRSLPFMTYICARRSDLPFE